MKKYVKEIIVLFLQLFMFYIFPLFAGPTDAMGMVVLIHAATAILSLALGCLSHNGIKFLYPVAIAVLFIPSVFIYYNETALIHAVWYLVVSAVCLLIGALVHKIAYRKK
ncbi:MAG: hypothetical protein IJO76_07620 [Clostridia bacterium]|nr:hypothetical protein [Clostridia bacterium]